MNKLILLLFLILLLSVYNFVVSFNVSSPRPAPIPYTHNLPCKKLVAFRIEPRKFFMYNYVTYDFIKIIFLVFLRILFLPSNITSINVRYVNFRWNLSILPRRYETKFLLSHTFQSWVYVYTFLSLYEPFLLVFELDKTFLLYFQ